MVNPPYHFPRTRFVASNTLAQQIAHVRSELAEVWAELEHNYPHPADPARVAEELLDLIHSAETALRIVEEQHNIDATVLMWHVAAKNHKRGYYAD